MLSGLTVRLAFSNVTEGGPGVTTVLWQDFAPKDEQASFISLPEYVEDNADLLRACYMDLLDALQSHFTRRSAKRRLQLSGLKLYNLLLPTHFHFADRSFIYDAVRLIALAHILRDAGATRIMVDPGPSEIVQAVQILGQDLKVEVCHSLKPGPRNTGVSLRAWLRSVRAGMSIIRDFAEHWRPSPRSTRRTSCDINIVDYWAHVSSSSLAEGKYRSNYWGPLTELLRDLDMAINWTHIYVPTGQFPHPRATRTSIRNLNLSNLNDHHQLLGASWSLRGLVTACWLYIRLLVGTMSLTRSLGPGRSTEPVWSQALSTLAKTNLQSMIGSRDLPDLASQVVLIECAVKLMPRASALMFISEGQAWELLLADACRRHHKASLIIAVLNSTARFWDLRPRALRSLIKSEQGDRRMQVLIVVNGAWAYQQLQEIGFHDHHLFVAESLRGLPVDNLVNFQGMTPSNRRRVLFLGDFNESIAECQWDIACELSAQHWPDIDVAFRPHPVSSFEPVSDTGSVVIARGAGPEDDIRHADLVVSGPVTGGVLDAIQLGRSVAVVGDGRFIDGSPLPPDLRPPRIESSADVMALLDRGLHAFPVQVIADLTILEPSLPRWRSLLAEARRNSD